VLIVSYLLVDDQLHRTLPAVTADATLDDLAGQYAIATVGFILVAVAVGWMAAGRVLAPLKTITATARHVTHDQLGERIDLGGPHDELRELADTVDEMLDRLEDSMEAQRRFVANASHELRSPLTVIRAEAEVTLSDPDAEIADLRRMGTSVLEATDRTEALLDGLMVLARSQRGLVRRSPVDLAISASRAVADVTASGLGRNLRLDVQAEHASVLGDEALLGRLVANLVINAARYNEPNGWVQVRTGNLDGGAFVRVINTGPQIPPASLQRLTEPFERLGRRHGDGGSGLGLSIVRAVSDAHDATLRLLARDGGGLDVTVSFPAVRPA